MQMSTAGWHPDYEDPTQERYWDGTRWTDKRRPARLPGRYQGPDGATNLAADTHALGLLEFLGAGGRPATVSATFKTLPGEEVYCSVEGDISVLAEGQYYEAGHTTFGIGSSFLMLGMTLGASALVNARRTNRARAAAALQWRPLTVGVAHLTSHRVAAQGAGGWTDIWLANVNQVVLDDKGVVLLVGGSQPLRVGLGNTLYAYVLLYWLVMGSVPALHPEVASAIRAAKVLLEPPGTARRGANQLPR